MDGKTIKQANAIKTSMARYLQAGRMDELPAMAKRFLLMGDTGWEVDFPKLIQAEYADRSQLIRAFRG